jgi:hypothetical protein
MLTHDDATQSVQPVNVVHDPAVVIPLDLLFMLLNSELQDCPTILLMLPEELDDVWFVRLVDPVHEIDPDRWDGLPLVMPHLYVMRGLLQDDIIFVTREECYPLLVVLIRVHNDSRMDLPIREIQRFVKDLLFNVSHKASKDGGVGWDL